MSRVYEACYYANISEETFKGWVEVIRHGFIKRNIISMAKIDCEEVGYENANIDGRSFLEVTEANAKQ